MTTPSTVHTIVAIVIGKDNTSFYKKDDGSIISIRSDDHRLESLVLQANAVIKRQGFVEINFENHSIFSEVSKKTNGFVRFFRAAKEKIVEIFTAKEEEDAAAFKAETLEKELETALNESTTAEAVADNMKEEIKQVQEKPVVTVHVPKPITKAMVEEHLSPIEEEVHDTPTEDTTIVAVIGDLVIPNIEKLRPYIEHAARFNTAEAIQNFFKRILPMIGTRDHSIEDLLRFMEKGDLPLANDGCIIAYKRLKGKNGVFFDIHSGNVNQTVGCYVHVDPSLVDKNRRNECSNGLHIARRDYVRTFIGNVLTLVKLAPEDVVTVPHGDTSKIRACGYHIIFELNDEMTAAIQNLKPITTVPGGAAILDRAIKGQHVGRICTTKIGGQRGSNLSFTGWDGINPPLVKKVKKDDLAPTKIANSSVSLDKENEPKADINTKTLIKKVKAQDEEAKSKPVQKAKEVKARVKVETKVATTQPMTKAQKARKLYEDYINNADGTALAELKNLQKTSKVSWTKLGFLDEEADLIKTSK